MTRTVRSDSTDVILWQAHGTRVLRWTVSAVVLAEAVTAVNGGPSEALSTSATKSGLFTAGSFSPASAQNSSP